MGFTGKTKCFQALPCSLADYPHIITCFDVAHHKANPFVCYRAEFYRAPDVNIIFGMVSKNNGSIRLLPKDSCNYRCRSRAVGMNHIRGEGSQFGDSSLFKRIARAVSAGKCCGIIAPIRYYPVRIG